MFQLLILFFVQSQFIGFGFWSIWYSIFHVSPTIQRLDRTPVLVIRYTGIIYLVVRMSTALFYIYNSKDRDRYIDYYFGNDLIHFYIDLIWYLLLSQLIWINFFLKSRWYRLINGLLAIIPISFITSLLERFDGASHYQYFITPELNIFVFYLINLWIYLMAMLVIKFFMDKWSNLKIVIR